jgi:hypothetical protein
VHDKAEGSLCAQELGIGDITSREAVAVHNDGASLNGVHGIDVELIGNEDLARMMQSLGNLQRRGLCRVAFSSYISFSFSLSLA